jgi:hypothetical protein
MIIPEAEERGLRVDDRDVNALVSKRRDQPRGLTLCEIALFGEDADSHIFSKDRLIFCLVFAEAPRSQIHIMRKITS